MGEGATITISTILGNVTSVVTSAVSWMGSFATFVVDNPLVLLFVLIPLVGLGIGLFRRLLSL